MPFVKPVSVGPALVALGDQLLDVGRCPHCSIANPNLIKVWASAGVVPHTNGDPSRHWGAYSCSSCGNVISVRARLVNNNFAIEELFPESKAAHNDLPELARKFLQQAFETLHAPDAAAVMAGSAVDAMLKHLGYKDGSLYARIDRALEDNVLTQAMANWAHEVRLGSNRPRHADDQKPNVSEEEAKQSVEFAEALGHFLFVLTARIKRGIEAAKAAEG